MKKCSMQTIDEGKKTPLQKANTLTKGTFLCSLIVINTMREFIRTQIRIRLQGYDKTTRQK